MDVINRKGDSSEDNKYWKYKFAIVLIASAFFLYLAWYAYKTQVATDIDPDTLPLIQFDKQIKFKPGDPGGIEIANLDKGIYDYISGRKSNNKVVISNSKEDPLSRNEMLSALGEDIHKEEKKPVIRKMDFVRAPAENHVVKSLEPHNKKIYYIRIAKLKNASVKGRAWEILQKKHSEILSDLSSYAVVEHKSGEYVYYLQAGPISSYNGASSLCRRLIAKGNACKVQALDSD